MKTMLKRLIALLLSVIMLGSVLPLQLWAAEAAGTVPVEQGAQPTSLSTQDGEVPVEEDWDETYPYGTFAFGSYQADLGEPGAKSQEGEALLQSALIPVYRIGGTRGWATVKITYAPAVTTDKSGLVPVYDYAASGKSDILLEVEDTNPLAEYQEIGLPQAEREMLPAPSVELSYGIDEDNTLHLSLIHAEEAESYRWQYKGPSGGWKDIEDGTDAALQLTTDDYSALGITSWDGLDFRCILSVQGYLLCSVSKDGESFVPYQQAREIPADVKAPEEPSYTPIEFDEDYDIYEFTLTFAEGETVKYLRVTALDDDVAELPELGLFTIVGCEGGECSDLCNTLTLMISDNDEAEPSEIGFEVTEISVDRLGGVAYATVRRTGGSSYNVTVDYETVDGSAKAGVDYAACSGSLAFAGSIDEIKVAVQLISTDETGEKSFSLRLSNLRGGGTEELCKLRNDTLTFTLRGESPQGELGQNLATVLAGSDGTDLSAQLSLEEDALIRDTRKQTVDVRMPEGESLEGKLVTKSNPTRTYVTDVTLQFTRDNSYNSKNYWHDWEIICGSDTTGQDAGDVRADTANTVDYSGYWSTKVNTYDKNTNKDKPEPVDGLSGGVDKNGYGTYVKMQTVVPTESGNYMFNKGYLELSANYKGYAQFFLPDAGKLYDGVEIITYLEGLGYKKASPNKYIQPEVSASGDKQGLKPYSSDYYMCLVTNDNVFQKWIYSDGWNSNKWLFNWNQDSDSDAWDPNRPVKPFRLALDNDLKLTINFLMYKAYANPMQEVEGYEKMQDNDQWTVVDIPVFRVHRRVFEKTNAIPVYLYTSNDQDEAGSSWTALPSNADIYKKLTPSITIPEGGGGVNENGQFYVGTTFHVDLGQVPPGYEIPTSGLFLTNSKGERVGTAERTSNTSCNIRMDWDGMTEDDLTKESYRLNILLMRKQTIEVDFAPSVPSGGSAQTVFDTFMSKTPTVTYSQLKYQEIGDDYVPVGTVSGSSILYFGNTYTFPLELVLEGTTGKYSYSDLQKICFNQDERDIILYNGRAYKGNEAIVLCADDLLNKNAHFTYYHRDYLDRVSPMAVFIDHAELYLDNNGDAAITGSFVDNKWVSSVGDEYITARLSGDYPESIFKPELDAKGVVHQYVLRVYYTMRPRAYLIPAGGSDQDTAQILPGVASAITQKKEFAALTPEQQSYRYLKGGNTDGHAMYGKEATNQSYVDIPMGGDLATIYYENGSVAVKDKNGKITGMDTSENYTWVPNYVGNLLVKFQNPAPVIDTNNVTGKPVPIAGKNLTLENGKFNYDNASRAKMNAFLGAMIGRSTFILGVQQEKMPLGSIKTAAQIVPETVAIGTVATTPNADSVMNQTAGGDPGTTEGETPGEDAGHPEFGADLGTSLPNLELELGDYATLIMDGYQVGFAIGIPIYKYEDTNYSGSEKNETNSNGEYHSQTDGDGKKTETRTNTENGKTTTTETITEPNNSDPKKVTQRTVTTTTTVEDEKGNKTTKWVQETQEKKTDPKTKKETWEVTKRDVKDNAPPAPSQQNQQQKSGKDKFKEGFSEANGGMQTLADFIGACTSKNKDSLKEFFSGTFEDESYKNAKNGNCTSTKVEVSFTVQISIMFEFNPIDNCHYFKSAGLSATLGIELSAQHRFSAAPICYVYVKLGIEVEVAVSLSCIRNPKLGKEITSFREGSLPALSRGQAVVFELNMKKHKEMTDIGKSEEVKIRGFHIDLLGSVYMEVFKNPDLSGGSIAAGYLCGDGTEKEVLYEDYNRTVYVRLTPMGGQVVADRLRPVTGASSKVVFDGLSITPSISLEAGVGVGIELLKFEVFVKTSVAITMTMGGYLEETDSYEGFYISSFEWGLCLGFNIVALFFNYSMDAIGISVEGEQHGTGGYFSWNIKASALNGDKELWSKDTFTAADGKPLGTEEPEPPADNNIGPLDPGYTFYNANNSKLVSPIEDGFPVDSDWSLKERVKAWEWDGGEFKGEVPQDGDLCKANKDDLKVQFDVPADTGKIKLYFDGTLSYKVSSNNSSKDNVKKSPVTINVGAKAGTVTLTLKKGTKLDRWAVVVPDKQAPRAAEPIQELNTEPGESLIHVSGPTDISLTQYVTRAGEEDSRAITPTGTADFELSGFNTAGDAKKLVSGLTNGYSYKLFQAEREKDGKKVAENYILYPLMLEGKAQLVLSRVVMEGNLSQISGLEHPTDPNSATPYLKVDNDSFGDLDYNVSVSGKTITVVWSAYDSADPAVSAVESAKHIVVKQAGLTLGTDAAFSAPTLLTKDTGSYRFLPVRAGSTVIWAEGVGDGSQRNTALAAYLLAVNEANGLTAEMLENRTTNKAELANAVYRWVLESDLNAIRGDSSRLMASTGAAATIQGETLENIELGVVGGKTVALYSTTQTAYFDTAQETPVTVAPENFNADTELASIRRLYLRQLSGSSWGEAKLLQTVIDFDSCTDDNIESQTLKDGVYAGNALQTAQADPYYGNLRFLQADLDGKGTKTVLLFEMGGNSYLLQQADALSLLSGGTGSILPIFQSTTGTDVAIGSDGENLAVVYTAAVPNSVSNAIYTAWWDRSLGTWGSPTILAMRHLQVYEDSIKYDLSNEEQEKAYLGKLTGNTAYDSYLANLSDAERIEAAGSMSRLTFSDLQMSTRNVEKSDGTLGKQLLVMTMGSLQQLQDYSIPKAKGGTTESLAPAGPAVLNFYAVAFGVGEQALGEVSLTLSNYDFSVGSKMVGGLSFVNTGTTAIRGSGTNPITVTLKAVEFETYVDASGIEQRRPVWNQDIAAWKLSESIPSGGAANLSFRSEELKKTLPVGTEFCLYVNEDASYFGTNAFAAEVQKLLIVEQRPELSIADFTAELVRINGDRAELDISATVRNQGNTPAAGVYLQFSYDTGTKDDCGLEIYRPVNIVGSKLETEAEEKIPNRQKVSENYEYGVYQLLGPEKDPNGGIGAQAKKLTQGYYRIVKGTLVVPTECFVSQEELSGLHLKVEAYSDFDSPDFDKGLYSSDHNEYNGVNNSRELILKHQTIFSVPDHIVTALGTTLTLPVSYETTCQASELVLTEISDGTEDWEPRMGVCYYDAARKVIVAAPNAKAQQMLAANQTPTGILQIQDTGTNTIAAIAYTVGAMAEGVNIYRDDASFTFHDPNGKLTDLNAGPSTTPTPGWLFRDWPSSTGWDCGKAGEIPMNYDLSVANLDGAYVEFETVADTLTIYFMGSIKVISSEFGTFPATSTFLNPTPSNPTTGAPAKYGPVKIEFGNNDGKKHKITIIADKGTMLDRYVATYKTNTVPVTDPDAPLLLWNRSYPDTASVKTGGSVPMTCYILDGSGLQSVSFDGRQLSENTDPKLVKVDENLWYFDYNFNKNGIFRVDAMDLTGNSSAGTVAVNWFNDVLSAGSNAEAPGLMRSHLGFVDANGSAVNTSQILRAAPYLKSAYAIASGESSNAYLYQSGSFSANALAKSTGERWLAGWNGYYQVRVDRADGTWARAIVPLTTLNLTQSAATLNLEGEGTPDVPYLIGSLEDWQKLKNYVAGGYSTAGMCFLQTADLSVTEADMIGPNKSHRFNGSYDGGGHTINFNTENGTSDCGPFCYINDAAFQNLHIAGTVTTSNRWVGGIATDVTGGCTIINCRSSLVIHSNVNGLGAHGGFISTLQANSELTMIGCTFDGALYGENTTSSSAFVGNNKSVCRFTDCFCVPSAFEWKATNTFSWNSTSSSVSSLNNCYYTMAPSDLAPNDAQGTEAYSVKPGTNTELSFGIGTDYDTALLSAYGPGLQYNGVFYAGAGETVTLEPSCTGDPEDAESVFEASAGSFSNTKGSTWFLTMPAENVIISMADHKWSEPWYEWSDDNSTVTAYASCEYNLSHVVQETAKTSFVLTQPSTFETEGAGYYQATFTNSLFAEQQKSVVVPAAACAGGDACPSKAFTDMPPVTDYAHIPIDWAVLNQITFGTSATTFGPKASCTRAQFVTFLWRVKGQPEPASENNPFKDVKSGAYYYKAVLWAVEQGVTNGTSKTTFSPNSKVTRAQVVTFLWRFEGELETAAENPFDDVKPKDYFYKAVLWAVEKGVTSGTSKTTFSPADNCTRAQCVTFLYREFGK